MTPDKQPRIGLVMKSLAAEFFQAMLRAAKAHVEQRGDLVLIPVGTDSQTELDRQIALVEDLVRQKVDGLVVVPIDSRALVPPVAKAVKAGIKVVNIDIRLDPQSLAEHQVTVPFVGPDNEAAAQMVGDVLARQLGAGAEVVTIDGVTGAANAEQRKAGFVRAIRAHRLTLAGSGVGNWETDQAARVFAELLAQHPNLRGVMSGNDAMALGVLRVLAERGRTDVRVVGFDNDASIQPLIREGRVLATIEAHGSRMAAEGIDCAMRALAGEAVRGYIETPVELITRDALSGS
jgi:ribose transport system substrate-binding protein